MSFFQPQNPGIGGLDELTEAEALMIQSLASLSYASGDILYHNGTSLTRLPKGSNGQVLTLAAGLPSWAAGGGSGTVTSVSVATANGFAGTVTNPTTTPAITVTTTINGILSGNGTSISAASTTGTGSVVLSGSPSLTTPSIAAINVSGGTLTLPTGASSTLVSLVSTGALTNKDLTSGTNTFPTFNQNTTGSAATLTTTRTIWGQNFNGSANVTGDITLGSSSITLTGSIGATGARATKIWATDIESTNAPTVGGVRVQTTSPLVVSATSYTTDTGTSLNMDNLDMFVITAQAGALLFNAPGGTLTQGRKLIIRIKDNGTARALTWNSVFRAMGTALPSTTVLSKTLYLGFTYNSTDTKWDLIASAQEA